MRLVVVALLLGACGGPQEPLPMPDMTPVGDGGTKMFGDPCGGNAECASNVCFMGGNRSFCSLRCSMATAATDCPKPPTSGTCNMQGYCKP
jgi:hypothetical protein